MVGFLCRGRSMQIRREISLIVVCRMAEPGNRSLLRFEIEGSNENRNTLDFYTASAQLFRGAKEPGRAASRLCINSIAADNLNLNKKLSKLGEKKKKRKRRIDRLDLSTFAPIFSSP